MWVADKSDDKLYAYEWPQMTRHETLDIPLDPGNDHPGNIWSDGAHIWVFDRSRKSVVRLQPGQRCPSAVPGNPSGPEK